MQDDTVTTDDNIVANIDITDNACAGSDIYVVAYYGEFRVSGFSTDSDSLADHTIPSDYSLSVDNHSNSMVGKSGVFADSALWRHYAVEQEIVDSVDNLGNNRYLVSIQPI